MVKDSMAATCSYVEANRRDTAAAFVVVEKAQEFRLNVQWHFTDFIQE